MGNPKKVCKQLFLETEDLGHVEYRYEVIGRLISIRILWESFYPNTSIKVNSRYYSFIIHHLSLSSFLAILLHHLSLLSLSCSIHGLGSSFSISYSETWIVFCQASTIELVF